MCYASYVYYIGETMLSPGRRSPPSLASFRFSNAFSRASFNETKG